MMQGATLSPNPHILARTGCCTTSSFQFQPPYVVSVGSGPWDRVDTGVIAPAECADNGAWYAAADVVILSMERGGGGWGIG
jgi:hypothetical protein